MSAEEVQFWTAMRRMAFSDLRDVAAYIYNSWNDRECKDDALNFAAALSEYAAEALDV